MDEDFSDEEEEQEHEQLATVERMHARHACITEDGARVAAMNREEVPNNVRADFPQLLQDPDTHLQYLCQFDDRLIESMKCVYSFICLF